VEEGRKGICEKFHKRFSPLHSQPSLAAAPPLRDNNLTVCPPAPSSMHDLGKTLVFIGALLVIAGMILWKTGGLGGLGQLPGDIVIRKSNSSFYFPLVTCLLISLVLTLLTWLLRK
jgi:hypothetical protein